MGRQPHDNLIKGIFSDTACAGKLIREFLPDSRLELETLRLVPGHFVDEQLRRYETDLLFSVGSQGSESLVYILLEHQRNPGKWMPLRLQRYAARIQARWMEQARVGDVLPPILPLVIYNGLGPWSGATRLTDLHGGGTFTGESWFPAQEFKFELMDLHRVPDRRIREKKEELGDAVTLALFCLKYAGRREFLSMLAACRDMMEGLLDRGQNTVLTMIIEYTLLVTDLQEDKVLRVVAPDTNSEMHHMVQSTYDRLIQKGRELGLKEGIKEGRREELVRVLLRLMETRFGPLDATVVDRCRGATDEELARLEERILEAPTLEALFED